MKLVCAREIAGNPEMIIYLSFGLVILALLAVLSAGVVVLLGGLLGALIGGILGRKTVPEEGRELQSYRGIAFGCFQGVLLGLLLVLALLAVAWQYLIS
jgi:hypothetical protein